MASGVERKAHHTKKPPVKIYVHTHTNQLNKKQWQTQKQVVCAPTQLPWLVATSNTSTVCTLLFHKSCCDIDRLVQTATAQPFFIFINHPSNSEWQDNIFSAVWWGSPPTPPNSHCMSEWAFLRLRVYLSCSYPRMTGLMAFLLFLVPMPDISPSTPPICRTRHSRPAEHSRCFFNSLAPGSSCSAGQALPVKGLVVTGGPCAHSLLFVFYVIISLAHLPRPAPSK